VVLVKAERRAIFLRTAKCRSKGARAGGIGLGAAHNGGEAWRGGLVLRADIASTKNPPSRKPPAGGQGAALCHGAFAWLLLCPPATGLGAPGILVGGSAQRDRCGGPPKANFKGGIGGKRKTNGGGKRGARDRALTAASASGALPCAPGRGV